MKARTVSVALFHFRPGRHRQVNTWYDNDHRPEVHGNVPLLYHSQRYVASAEYVAARPPTGLPHGGGEYLTLYWSEGTPEQIQYEIGVLGGRLEVNGRSDPLRFIDSVWRHRMHVVGARARPGFALSPDAVPIAPHSGIVLTIGEVVDPRKRVEYGQWHELVHIPEVLDSGLFTAFFRLRPASRQDVNIFAHLFFVSSGDPLTTFADYQDRLARWGREGRLFPNIDRTRRIDFAGPYRPVVPGQYDCYE